MQKYNKLPTQLELLALFSYDPDTGVLRWREDGRRCGNSVRVFATYNALRGAGSRFYTTRVIWKMVHNEEPPVVEHRDGTASCRLSNLRAATHSQNQMNRSLQPNNKVGAKGVHRHRGRFRARISADGRHIELGEFLTLDEAVAARKKAEKLYHGDFASA